jgi:phosphoglycolate phosphatase
VQVLQPVPFKNIRLLVFDLDGTLIDSRDDLAQSINAMLAHYGRPSLPADVIATYIGDGAPMLVRRALGDPDDEHLVHEALDFFLAYYKIHKLDYTYVYDGVIAALTELRDHWPHGPVPSMAILTNKPVGASRAICEALGLSPFFFQIYGGNSFHTKKPDPHGLQTLMKEANAAPAETLMIGDSDVDVLTARNAGAWAMGCTFGLAPHTLEAAPPDVLVDSPTEWPVVFAIGRRVGPGLKTGARRGPYLSG